MFSIGGDASIFTKGNDKTLFTEETVLRKRKNATQESKLPVKFIHREHSINQNSVKTFNTSEEINLNSFPDATHESNVESCSAEILNRVTESKIHQHISMKARFSEKPE